MGYIKHDAIIITYWDNTKLDAIVKMAQKLDLQVLGPSEPAVNNYSTILICPDGSKEGWEESELKDISRTEFIEYLKTLNIGIEWCAVSYGSDDESAFIKDHAWTRL